jgi:hypothetical protein
MKRHRWLSGIVAAVAVLAPLAAAAQGELVVYCTVQEEWCRPMVAAFEKATGIKVLMTRKSSGEFYAQIKAEAANPRGDIWWGGTGDPHLQAAEEGLTQEYKSPKLAELQDWALRQAESAKYRTVGVYAGALGYSYNTEQLRKKNIAEPRCWSDLVKPAFKDEIQVANPNSSGTSYTMLATLVQLMGEDKAFDYLKALHRREPRRHHLPARRGGPGGRRRAAEDRVAVRRHRLRDRQHEHHQGREEPGEREEVVRLGAVGGGAEHRRAGEGVLPGTVEQERERTAAGTQVLRDQAHQLRLRQVRLVGRAHAPAGQVGQGSLDAAEVTRRTP